MKYLIVFISLVLFSETIQAQYKQVEVIMKDGRKRKGLSWIVEKISEETDWYRIGDISEIVAEYNAWRASRYQVGEKKQTPRSKYKTICDLVQHYHAVKQADTAQRQGK